MKKTKTTVGSSIDNLPTIGCQSTKNSNQVKKIGALMKKSSDTPLIKLMQIEESKDDQKVVSTIEEEAKVTTTLSSENDGINTVNAN